MDRLAFISALILLSSLPLFSSFGPDQILFGPRHSGMAAADMSGDESPESIMSNPAGLTLLSRGRVSFGMLLPSSSASITLAPMSKLIEAPSESATSLFMTAAYPISDKLIVGVLYSTPTDYRLSWPGEDLKSLTENRLYTWQSRLQIKRISAAAAYAVSGAFSLGGSINVERLDFSYSLPFGTGQYEETSNASSISFTLGLRAQLAPQLSAGLSYTSAQNWDLVGTAEMPSATQIGLAGTSALTRAFSGPSRLAGGITFQFSEKLKFAASFLSSSWDSLETLTGEFTDSGWEKMFGSHDLDLSWTSTLQIRIGTEYQATNSLAVRAGFATSPSATPEKNRHPLLFSLAGQNICIGGSLALNDFSIDASLVIPLTSASILSAQQTTNWPGKYEASMVIPSISLSYSF